MKERFEKLVAVKTVIAQHAQDDKFEKMFLDGRPPVAVGVTSGGDLFGGTQITFSDVLGDHGIAHALDGDQLRKRKEALRQLWGGGIEAYKMLRLCYHAHGGGRGSKRWVALLAALVSALAGCAWPGSRSSGGIAAGSNGST